MLYDKFNKLYEIINRLYDIFSIGCMISNTGTKLFNK